ncbi:uncharacterized protein LOC126392789 [Epinephelus moara]|uniref:uncharacterized protein LOC126392789 n=1 Tax=Epinephelus moara TaxID=300413 RepID=UPI00214E2E05|nr:uncharacterized protein LOC126392789 [Epinephelus moara]
MVVKLPSYLGDTTDVLNLVNGFVTEKDFILVTCDIQSLYTCIPHHAGIEALNHYLNTRPPDVLPPNVFLKTLTEIILSKNYFQYAGSYFLQKQRVSMGSLFAPSYACLVMGFWEEEFIHNSMTNPFVSKIALWKRYIDDIFFIWTGTTDELIEFVGYINSTTQYLRFTVEQSNERVNFLDLTIYKKMRGGLDSTIYQKPLSRNTLLRADSHHPKQLIKNIPTGQFLHLKRNCSTDEEFELKADEMTESFRSKGYKEHDIRAAYQRARRTDRARLLQKTQRPSTTPRLYFSTEFSPIAGDIKNIIKKHWHILQSDPALTQICAQPPLISFHKARSLKDRLVHSAMSAPQRSTWLPAPPTGFYRCGHCSHCSNSSDSKQFCHPHSGKK